jgi:M6 family metalloprotease-like protein
MRKILSLMMVYVFAVTVNAMPARPGFRTVLQADGTTIEVQRMGDELYHYTVNREGQEVKLNANGIYEVVGEAPTADQVRTRRAQSKMRRAKREVGQPNLSPRGLLILANFSDKSFKSTNTKAVMDSLINAKNCQVNNGFGSAAQYFRDQSNGQYEPVFDVYGPVTLSNGYKYYGENDDQYATDAVIEACLLANQKYSDLDFTKYNSDNDEYVDFVYVIYAGNGEADTEETTANSYLIWPHNYSIQEVVAYYQSGYSKYTKAQTKVDGLYLDNYAMSQELDGYTGERAGNGTFCHEFGHVIGLPDFYDTKYSTNYKQGLTPNNWDVMDGGGYNGDGHCPPNYSAWEKYFMGWLTPENLGTQGAKLTLYPNGTEQHNVYQINTSGKLESATKEGLNYYIECRQQAGWDTYIPAEGMLIWQVNYSSSAWSNNEPNNTAGSPKYTLTIPSGTVRGGEYGEQNVWPYNKTNSWSGVTGKPLKEITKVGNNISLIYIEEPVIPIDPFDIIYVANGEPFDTVTTTTGKVVLPTATPEACQDVKEFVGWCATATYESETTAPTFVKAGDDTAEGAIYYAVYATKNGDVEPAVEDKLTLAITGVSGSSYEAWNNVKVSSDAVYAGNTAGGNDAIQLRSKNSTSGIITTASGGKVSKIEVAWNENTSPDRTLDIYGKNTAYSAISDLYDANNKGTKLGSIAYGSTTLNISGDYTYIGLRSNDGALYLDAINVTWGEGGNPYSNYTTVCGGDETDVENTAASVTAVKTIRNGQLVIIRGNAVYSASGARIQ